MMLGVEHVEDAAAEEPTLSGQQSEMSELTKSAAQLLHKRLRMTVLDGRVLIGDFICLDKQGNIILQNSVEQVEIEGRREEKFLGQILVSAKQRVTCEVQVAEQDLAAVEKLIADALARENKVPEITQEK